MTLLPMLVDQLTRKEPHVSQSDQPHATASQSLTCARQIGYKVAGIEPDQPVTLTSLLAFCIGDFLHAHVQAALKARYADFRDEVRFDRGAVTGRADGLYSDDDGNLVVAEIKTMSAKGFAWAASHGPKPEHVMQASMAALAFGAAHINLIYLAKESSDSPLLEWTMPADLEGAAKEEARMQRIVANVMAGRAIPRQANGLLYNPATTGYPCSWCSFKQRCLDEGE